jgi:phage-related protein
MPVVQLLFYREPGEVPPVLEWLDGLPLKARERVYVKLRQLAGSGHELRRPNADILRDDIWELRPTYQGQQLRILYFFEGQGLVIVAHRLKKEAKVPQKAIELALARRERFRADPEGCCAEVVI